MREGGAPIGQHTTSASAGGGGGLTHSLSLTAANTLTCDDWADLGVKYVDVIIFKRINMKIEQNCPLDKFKPCRQTKCAWFTKFVALIPRPAVMSMIGCAMPAMLVEGADVASSWRGC